MRLPWKERKDRLAWDTSWTVIGGSYREGYDELQSLEPEERASIERALSQVFVAASPARQEPPEELKFWASTVRKIVQRGTRPPAGLGHPSSRPPSNVEIMASIFHAPLMPLDSDVVEFFDNDLEVAMWDAIGETSPHIQRWTIPQADFATLVGNAEGAQWVDFLITVPATTPRVLELDGDTHKQSRAADEHRDQELKNAGILVRRRPTVGSATSRELLEGIGNIAPPLPNPTSGVFTSLYAPAQCHRLAYAIAESVERGFLIPGVDSWSIDLNTAQEIGNGFIEPALNLLAAVADVWDLDILPRTILIGGRSWDTGLRSWVPSAQSAQPDAAIFLNPFVSPVTQLPESDAVPSVIIRSTHLPVDLPYAAPTTIRRFNRSRNDRTDTGLRNILEYMFGFSEFREAQLEAISRVLSGGDALVLLPTGAGKTLIYQIAGLMRPGLTLVIAPLQSLIDDQCLRLVNAGIDRAVAINAGLNLTPEDKTKIHDKIAEGEAIFAVISPERLLLAEFRRSLVEAATNHQVNLSVIDEAHSVSEWGHQFRTAYLRLGRNLRRLCKDSDDQSPPVLAMTATAGPAVLRDLAHDLEIDLDEPGLLHRPETFKRANLHYQIINTDPTQRKKAVGDALVAALGELRREFGLPDDEVPPGVIFTPWVNGALGLSTFRELINMRLHIPLDDIAYYAGSKPKDVTDMSSNAWNKFRREEIIQFRTGKKPFIVCTKAFGMGIDIPGIRCTVHVSMPPSLEGFAQESGRAGRDGQLSKCILVAAPAPPEMMHTLLNPFESQRRKMYKALPSVSAERRDDIDVQLYFHYGAFPDAEDEAQTATDVFLEIEKNGGSGTIPRSRDDKRAELEERGLYRLAILGIVEDYTVAYQAGRFDVEVGTYDEVTLRQAFTEYLQRVLAETTTAENWLRAAPSDSISNLVRYLVLGIMIYAQSTIERGRLEALREMQRIVVDGLDNDAIQDRIDSYLGAGQVAALLDRVVKSPTLSMQEFFDALDLTPPTSPEEWAGVGARYAESYPNHPAVTLVRAVGEAWRPTADRSTFRELLDRSLSNLASVGSHEEAEVARWVLNELRSRTVYQDRSGWATDVWDIMDTVGIDPATQIAIEDETLSKIASNELPVDGVESGVVLKRKINRLQNEMRPVLAGVRLNYERVRHGSGPSRNSN